MCSWRGERRGEEERGDGDGDGDDRSAPEARVAGRAETALALTTQPHTTEPEADCPRRTTDGVGCEREREREQANANTGAAEARACTRMSATAARAEQKARHQVRVRGRGEGESKGKGRRELELELKHLCACAVALTSTHYTLHVPQDTLARLSELTLHFWWCAKRSQLAASPASATRAAHVD